MIRLIPLAMALAMLGACSGDDAADAKTSEDHFAKDQKKALDAAKGVGDTLRKAEERQKKAVE